MGEGTASAKALRQKNLGMFWNRKARLRGGVARKNNS